MSSKCIMKTINENLNINMEKTLEYDSKSIPEILLKVELIDNLLNDRSNLECISIANEVKYDIITSIYFASVGLYRNAFISLRSSIELGIGFIYFLDRNYDYLLWKNGNYDLTWSALTDDSKGVLDYKYLSLFEDIEKEFCSRLMNEAKSSYRVCSEYVHGKYEFMQTKDNLKIEYDKEKIEIWDKTINKILDVLAIVYSIRFNDKISLLEDDSKVTLQNIENKFRFREVHISA